MPASKIFLDWNTRKFVDSSGGLVISYVGKNDSIIDFELAIVQDAIPLSLPAGSIVEAALKKPLDPSGTYLFHVTATRSGWGSGSKWFFRMDLTSNAFNTVSGTDVDFEVRMILPDGQHVSSLTFPFTVQKNVIP